jgi:spore coat polysaccharide biosynthesis predicted glycosyltransferase SpsG
LANFIFYCNGTMKTGFGHLSRCLNVARATFALQPFSNIVFFGDFDQFSTQRINNFGFTVAGSDFTFEPHMTVLADSYQFTFEHLFELKKIGLKLCIIDDFDQYNYTFIDLIVNFRFNAEAFCRSTTKHRLGVRYFSFAQELLSLRRSRSQGHFQNSINTILVFIGGNDRFDVATHVVNALDKLVVGKKIILLDQKAPSISLKNNTYQALEFVDDMSAVYKQADLIINGGGLTKYEAGFCLIPNCAISQTREQHTDTLELARAHLTFDLGLAEDATIESLTLNIEGFLHTGVLAQRDAMLSSYYLDSTEQFAQEIIKVSNE